MTIKNPSQNKYYYKHRDRILAKLRKNYKENKNGVKDKDKAYREKNRDRLNQNLKEYHIKTRPERLKYKRNNLERNRKEALKYYHKNKKEIMRKRQERYHNDPEYHKKMLARYKTRRDLKAGKIKKPNKCMSCKQDKSLEIHHLDYNKPLEVLWLCRICHRKLHRKYD